MKFCAASEFYAMDLIKRSLKIIDRFSWILDQVLCLAVMTKERKDDKRPFFFFFNHRKLVGIHKNLKLNKQKSQKDHNTNESHYGF